MIIYRGTPKMVMPDLIDYNGTFRYIATEFCGGCTDPDFSGPTVHVKSIGLPDMVPLVKFVKSQRLRDRRAIQVEKNGKVLYLMPHLVYPENLNRVEILDMIRSVRHLETPDFREITPHAEAEKLWNLFKPVNLYKRATTRELLEDFRDYCKLDYLQPWAVSTD